MKKYVVSFWKAEEGENGFVIDENEHRLLHQAWIAEKTKFAIIRGRTVVFSNICGIKCLDLNELGETEFFMLPERSEGKALTKDSLEKYKQEIALKFSENKKDDN